MVAIQLLSLSKLLKIWSIKNLQSLIMFGTWFVFLISCPNHNSAKRGYFLSRVEKLDWKLGILKFDIMSVDCIWNDYTINYILRKVNNGQSGFKEWLCRKKGKRFVFFCPSVLYVSYSIKNLKVLWVQLLNLSCFLFENIEKRWIEVSDDSAKKKLRFSFV